MTDREPERCCWCDDPTGRAGQGEDSLYCENPDCNKGPFCEDCYDDHVQPDNPTLKECIR